MGVGVVRKWGEMRFGRYGCDSEARGAALDFRSRYLGWRLIGLIVVIEDALVAHSWNAFIGGSIYQCIKYRIEREEDRMFVATVHSLQIKRLVI